MRRLLAISALIVLPAGCSLTQGDHRLRGASQRPPVVVLVLDEFPTDALLTPDGEIDRERFPNFAALAETSTWFPNAYTVYDSTFKAVPAILDAELPRPGTAADQRSHPHSLYELMARHGYGMVDVESASALCPKWICLGSRIRRPGILKRLTGSGRPPRLHRWIGAIRMGQRPTLYFQHTLLPHAPWIYLPSGNATRGAGREPIENVNRWPGFWDSLLTEHNELRHLLQVGFMDHELGLLLRRLHRTRLFEDVLLVVVADHGVSFDVGVRSRRQVSPGNVEEIAPVPFFVKEPGQTDGARNPNLVRNMDVLPTVADLLDVRVPWHHDGHSAFSAETRARRVVRIPTRDFERVVSIGGGELLRRRAKVRARRAAAFGTGRQSVSRFGDPWAAAYRIGPHTELLGRATSRFEIGPRGPLRAQVGDPGLVRRVASGKAKVHPTHVSGRLSGGAPGAQRNLAVSVNGRIQAVGRSFHLARPDREFFSLMIPERALRPGPSRIELFEVVRGPRLVRLAPAG